MLGARVDKFGNLSSPKFLPRRAFVVKPAEDHSITLSYNQAYILVIPIYNSAEYFFRVFRRILRTRSSADTFALIRSS